MTRRLVLTCAVALAAVSAASASPGREGAKMWPLFPGGALWRFVSSENGHTTRFGITRLNSWACWSGTLVDLWDVKQAPEDYWAPGVDAVGHQILIRDADGSWRMVGTYSVSPDPAESWTMQIHGYPDEPTPYVIAPGRRIDIDTSTEYWTTFSPGVIDSCMGADKVPTWGQHVYWRSTFRFEASGVLRAHYEENTCGPTACQVEEWTFDPSLSGIASITDLRTGGSPMRLALTRDAASSKATGRPRLGSAAPG